MNHGEHRSGVQEPQCQEGTRFVFFVRGPLPSGQWEMVIEVYEPDGKLLGRYVCEQPFPTRKLAEAAFPAARKAFREHLARDGILTSNLGLA